MIDFPTLMIKNRYDLEKKPLPLKFNKIIKLKNIKYLIEKTLSKKKN